ncbi:signal recognition particle protein [cyanobiont of Ornithocercus magnificus]|nr:signal recognition particle protein [cyanobiont of Ornithocercus magnificus]
MFDKLSARIEDVVKGLRGQGKISESNIDNALKQVSRALLEADVSLPVVKDFVTEVREKAVGVEVVRGISPDQKFIQVIHEQLVEVMGGSNSPLAETDKGPNVVLMTGLQGAGKTTATAKLGLYLKDSGRRPLMVAADTHRPAAIDQLCTLGSQIGVEVFSLRAEPKPEKIALAGLAKACEEGFDNVLIDTAGRLQIDTEMMEEMVQICSAVQPSEVLLVVDSMAGQEAADLVRAFHEQVGITGAVLTKLDGDSRGGAALSVRKISGQPIKFIGTGEKVEALQPFHPERMASRILGMGDVLTLVEKAQKEVELADIEKMQRKLEEASFDFTDFLQQMRLIKRMGSLGSLMKMIPGMNKVDDSALHQGEQRLRHIEAMINSMTAVERSCPELLASQPSRRRRIAAGSGHTAAEVDKVLADFQKMRGTVQQITRGSIPSVSGIPSMRSPGRTEPTGSGRRRRPPKKRKGFADL